MEPFDTIIETMKDQHRVLQDDLSDALKAAKSVTPDERGIEGRLVSFSLHLMEHLHLENDIFYPELLKRMQKSGADTSNTEDFIYQMNEIGATVMAFLEKYRKAPGSESGLETFRKELSGIISALNLRIESEEVGVYGYWELYK